MNYDPSDFNRDYTVHAIWRQFDGFLELDKLRVDESICKKCDYFMAGNPPACNALHTPGDKTECVDFAEKSAKITIDNIDSQRHLIERLEAERQRRVQQLVGRIHEKIEKYYCRTGKRPQKIVLHYRAFNDINLLLSVHEERRTHSGIHFLHFIERGRTCHEVDRILGCKMVRSQDVPEDFIGIIDCVDD